LSDPRLRLRKRVSTLRDAGLHAFGLSPVLPRKPIELRSFVGGAPVFVIFFMLIDWTKLIAALGLLLPPVALFHGKRVRFRGVTRDWDGYWGHTIALGTHAIDFVRAIFGSWLLAEAMRRAPDAQGVMRQAPLLIEAAVLFCAVALQTLVCKEPDTAHAPFAFIAGLALGFLPPLMPDWEPFAICGFALLLTTVVTFGARLPAVFFPLLALTLAAAGFLFTGKKLLLPLAILCSAVALPWLLTLLFPRDFVVSYLGKRNDPVVSSPKK
jgi:hypothetical protein